MQAPEIGEDHFATHVRRLRQRSLFNRLQESLLFVPMLLLAAAIAIEELVAYLDRRFDVGPLAGYGLPPDAAVTLLSTIAGATITTAGVVFSLLVVTLQLASGQFSPRVLRTFWRDRYGQVLIGLLLSTFAFCVLALTQIDTSAEYAPSLTLAFTLALTLIAIVGIVVYLNRITRNQYVGRIAERITGETMRLVRELPYGSNIGMKVGQPCEPPNLDALGAPLVIRAGADGWVQQISRRAIVEAVPAGSVVRLETRVGAFVVRGEPVASVWPCPDPGRSARTARLIGEGMVLGYARTMQQDIDFGLRQVNDIALRALSPAVNDPTTAIEMVLRIASVLRPLVCSALPAQVVAAEGGRVLLTPWDLDHAEFVAHGFSQLRVYGAGHAQVALAIVRSLVMLRGAATTAGNDDAARACDLELERTLDGCERADLLPADLAAIRRCVDGARVTGDAEGSTGRPPARS